MLGPTSGVGSAPIGTGTVSEAGTQVLTVSTRCTGSGSITVIATAGADYSRQFVAPCTPATTLTRGTFPAYEFAGPISVAVAALATSHWQVVVQRSAMAAQ